MIHASCVKNESHKDTTSGKIYGFPPEEFIVAGQEVFTESKAAMKTSAIFSMLISSETMR